MHAEVGDWLVVNSHAEGRPIRRAAIIAVGPDGEPPYTVRWTDTDHEGLVFPGPDADPGGEVWLLSLDAVSHQVVEYLEIELPDLGEPTTGDPRFGLALAAVGDLDGDGYTDLIASAPKQDIPGPVSAPGAPQSAR